MASSGDGVPASELFPLISGFLSTLGMHKTVTSLTAESKKWKEAVVRMRSHPSSKRVAGICAAAACGKASSVGPAAAAFAGTPALCAMHIVVHHFLLTVPAWLCRPAQRRQWRTASWVYTRSTAAQKGARLFFQVIKSPRSAVPPCSVMTLH